MCYKTICRYLLDTHSQDICVHTVGSKMRRMYRMYRIDNGPLRHTHIYIHIKIYIHNYLYIYTYEYVYIYV